MEGFRAYPTVDPAVQLAVSLMLKFDSLVEFNVGSEHLSQASRGAFSRPLPQRILFSTTTDVQKD